MIRHDVDRPLDRSRRRQWVAKPRTFGRRTHVASEVPVTRRCSHVKTRMMTNSSTAVAAASPGLAVLERLEIDEQRRCQRRLLRPAEVGGIDLVEDLPRADDPERHDEVDLRTQHRHDHVAEALEPRRPVDRRRLLDLLADVLQAAEEDQHHRPARRPDRHRHHREHRHRRPAQPLPPRQLEDLAAQPRRRLVDAEHAEQVVDEPVRLVEPVDVVDRQDAVDQAGRRGTARARSA